ncbi:uncharacterized protein TRAVEDRAFT_19074 [Trametes versicolor FP-101664 SS1]|uniref:uncharacterized protein n=1 Tax=Trametes versicolor (strain FP-101664) TaxID=717944 RepID=UPI0004621ADB|nr:uncharacterized protein TRAVEDRAFT_19074 [Trametes versicolor FP-101664 SS1]EIW60361.1 hypothetical protein TRAVEDRAFT_19074 [Trametes versicolor FP-101664 SS1]
MVQALPDAAFNYPGPTADTANVCTCSSIAYALFNGPNGRRIAKRGTSTTAASRTEYRLEQPSQTGPSFLSTDSTGLRQFSQLDEFDGVGSERIGDKFESIGSVAPTAAGSTPSTTGGSVTSLSSGPSATQHASTGAGVIPTSINSGAPASNTNGPDSPAETSGASTQTHSANIGGIVGGVVGGLVGVAMIAGLLVYFRRSRSRRTDGTGKGQMVYNSPENTAFIPPSAPPSPYYASARTDQDAAAATKESSPAEYVESVSFIAPEPITVVVPEMPPMRLYRMFMLLLQDPDDPTTFPPTPAPLLAPIPPRTTMAAETYPNVVPDQTHEDGDRVGTVGPVYGRRPVPELVLAIPKLMLAKTRYIESSVIQSDT